LHALLPLKEQAIQLLKDVAASCGVFTQTGIKNESLKRLNKELNKPHFEDVKFPMEEAIKLIEETLKDIVP